MSATITADVSSDTTEPDLVLGYQTSRESRNIVHDTLDGGIAITLIRPRPRAGTLELLYAVEADAFAALTLHEEETTFTLTDSDRPSINMTYVVDGSVELALDEETRDMWVVTVGYQEVEA